MKYSIHGDKARVSALGEPCRAQQWKCGHQWTPLDTHDSERSCLTRPRVWFDHLWYVLRRDGGGRGETAPRGK